MLFWLLTTFLVLASLFILLRPLVRPSDATNSPNSDLQVYKDQLAEVESDLARGVITAADATAMRSEVSRRLLKANDAAPIATPQQRPSLITIALVAILFTTSALGLYSQLGSPFLPGLPLPQRLADLADERGKRPSQYEAEEDYAHVRKTDPTEISNPDDLDLIAQLKSALATRPDDLRGHELLVQTQAQIGLWIEARLSQQQVLRIKGDAATGKDFLALGEYMVLAAGGFVSPEAEQAFADGLTLDPKNPRGRYFSGLALAQGGRPDLTYRLWVGLLNEGPPDAPWLPAITAALPEIAAAAGLPMPETLSGPTEGDIAAAAEMSEADRTAMIAGMVDGLSQRLNAQGGTAQEWAQLIRAYGVLGQTANAAAAWEKAKIVFAGDTASLQTLQQAAQSAEITN